MIARVRAQNVFPQFANAAQRRCCRGRAALGESGGRNDGAIERVIHHHTGAQEVGDRTFGSGGDAGDVVINKASETLNQRVLECILGCVVVQQAALGHAGGPRGCIHRCRTFTLINQDRLKGVEDAFAGTRGSTHGFDRIDGVSMILLLYRLDGLVITHYRPRRFLRTRHLAELMTMTHPIPTHMTSSLDGEGDGARVGWRGWAALVVLMLPVLLVSVDNTVLSFALPQIALDLAPSSAEQLWIIDAYPLVLAGLLVTMGSLGDRFGRRRMLLIGAIGFALISALAAFAPTAGALIAARAGMGVFGAMLMPSTLSLLRTIFTNRDQRRFAIAVWASGFSAGAALGPIVGGILLEHFAWGSVFIMAVPVLIPLLILAPILVPESRDPNPGRIDPISIVLSLGTMIPVVYAIKAIAVDGLGIMPIVLILVGFGLGALFVRRQLRAEAPMLDMHLFRGGMFSGGVLVNLLSVIALVGFLYFVAQHLQLIVGLGPIQAGLALVPGLLAMIVAGLVVVPIARRVRPGILVPAALVFSFVGYLLVPLGATAGGLTTLIIAFAALGIGIGAAETVSNELILSSAPPAKAGAASAVSETAYELGAVLGTAILGGILTAAYRSQIVVPEGVPADVAYAARETLAGAMVAADSLDAPLADALRTAAAHAFDAGVGTTALIGAGLVVVAAIIAATMMRGRA